MRQVSGTVGVPAAFAGPSEVVVVAGPDTEPELAAIDIVVQAEHGPDGLAWLVTWSEPSPRRGRRAAVERIVAGSSRRAELESTLGSGGHACLVDGPEAALAVANVIAPEHLELLFDGAADYLGLVQSAGAVFLGPWSPASLGDYVAGPNHVLPTNRSARFASALRVDDFRRHIHVVEAERAGLGGAGAARDRTGRHRGAAGARRVRADPAVSEPVPVRADLVELTGYHSPQVAAEVRLNTNESPFPPPEGWARGVRRRGRPRSTRTATRTAHARALRAGLAELHGVGADEIFCANGSNEVLQCLLLAFGGPGRRAVLFEPTYALHRHIARLTGTPVVTGGRDEQFAIDPDEGAALVADSGAIITFLCSPNNPTGNAERPEVIERLLAVAPGLVVVDEAYGQFARHSALALRAGPRADRLVVVRTFSKTWSLAAARLGYLVGSPAVVEACEQVVLPYHLSAYTQAAGVVALRFRAEMEARVALIIEERGRLQAALAELPVQSWPSDANFVLFRPTGRDAVAGVVGPRRAVGPRPGLLGLGRPGRVPAGHRRHPRGERPVLGVTGGVSHMTSERRASGRRATKETTVDGRPPDRRDGAGAGDNRPAVLRPHARAAGPPRRIRPVGHGEGGPQRRRAPHRRGRRASSSASAWPRRSATRRACAASRRRSSRSTRRSSRSPSTSRADPTSPTTSPSRPTRPGSARRRSTPSWPRSSGGPS